MKTVLVLAHYFYPEFSAGVPRMAKFCTYLQDNGWQPIAVCLDVRDRKDIQRTATPDPCEVIRVKDPQPYGRLPAWRRYARNLLLRFFRSRRDVPFTVLEREIWQQTRRICAERQIDAILASSWPQYTHRVADKLHRQFGIPWIADYRDIYGQVKRSGQRLLQRLKEDVDDHVSMRLDNRYSRSASFLTVVSAEATETMRARTGKGADVVTVNNGFDPNDFPQKCPQTAHTRLRIGYFGIFGKVRDPRPLFRGLCLLRERDPVAFAAADAVFFGPVNEVDDILNEPEFSDLKATVRWGGSLSHEDALQEMVRTDVLCLITSEGKGLPTGKLYEYMAAERPILTVPGDGDIADRMTRSSGLGKVAGTPDEVSAAISEWYAQLKTRGTIETYPDRAYIAQFTRQSQAKEMAELLDRTVGKQRE